MESNITKILIKKFWKRCVPPLEHIIKRYDPPLFVLTFSDAPPLWGPSPPPPPLRKTYLPLDPINAVKKPKILNSNMIK